MAEKEEGALERTLYVRVHPISLTQFEKNLARFGRKPSEFIREVIDAFNDGRLRIVPTDEQKTTMENLYDRS